jgi:uncharacterized membrane protein
MLIDWLLELKDSIDRHGIRMGVIITLYALFRKERRNMRLDQRDADVFHNQRVIMEKLGVADQWKGQAIPFQSEEVKSLRKLYSSSQVVIQQVNQLRRKKKMNQQNTNWATLVPAMFGAIKLILQPFGIDLSPVTDETINAIVNGVAGVCVVGGIIYNHFRNRKSKIPQPPYNPSSFQ